MNMTTETYILMSIIIAVSPAFSMFIMSALGMESCKEKEFFYTLITMLIILFSLALVYKVISF